jgi:hypothetical protein
MKQDALGKVVGEGPHTDNLDTSDEIKVIKRLAKSVCGIKRFRQALLVQRLLVEVQHLERSTILFQDKRVSCRKMN